MTKALLGAAGAVLVVLVCVWGGTAWAGVATSISLPNSGTSPAATGGLELNVDTNWVQGAGHLPVHLRLHTVKAEPVDRKLTVEVGTAYWDDNNYAVVSCELVLPAGEQQVEKWLPVPQVGWSQVLNVRSFAGRRLVEPLSITGVSMLNYNYAGNDSSVPRMLFVADQAPDVSALKFTTDSLAYGGQNNSTSLYDNFSLTQLARDRLFDEWIYYSGIDFTFLSLDDVRHLAANRPQAWQALVDWTRAGGVLCVFGMGRDDAPLAEIETLLKAHALPAEASAPHRGWESPAAETLETQVKQAMESQLLTAQTQAINSGTTGPASGAVTVPTVSLTAPAEPPFVWRRLGMGNVVALAATQPFPGVESDWRWMLATVAPNTSRWSGRFGIQFDGLNPGFNEFLIADVGLPPIGAYRVLISLFVVLIGPVNYWLLRRAGRLHLFLFTVPLAALVTSGALLGYAMLSDGLISRVRSRSFTMLDQPAARATSAARLSYYLAFAPSAGLTFPDDTLIVPYELHPQVAYSRSRAARRIEWGEQQRLGQGWLASRTPTQFVTQRSYACQRRLDVSAPADGKLTVVNRLGVPVIELLVRDAQGAWHAGSAIDAGKPAQLTLLASEAEIEPAASRFLKVLTQNSPGMPAGLSGYAPSNFWFGFGIGRLSMSGKAFATSNLLDESFQEVRTRILARELPPGSYVAIVERPEEIVVGIEDPVETQSTHVIQGRW